jgi:glycosyltransferase involved in cell wall biosynthesis
VREQVKENRGIPPEVTVIILTKDRPSLLLRAVASVARQEFYHRIEVLIVGDDCSYIKPGIFRAEFPQLSLRSFNVSGDVFSDASTLFRIASLRNLALSQVRTELVAFLDDDNQWSPKHLSSLYETMIETESPAVHSWRILVDESNREAVVDSFPWLKDRTRAIQRLEILDKLGLMSKGTAIVRDRPEAIYNNIDYGMVDCGEWLFRRRIIERVQFKTDFSSTDEFDMIGEDDKLLLDLKERQVPIACTNMPTLFYTLGGMSNRCITHSGIETASE